MPPKTEADPSIHLMAGGCAGFFATALLHPLDLIKTRLHVQEQVVSGAVRRLPYYHGLFDACRSILRIEGALGFYAGLAPNMIGNTGSWAVYMYAYNRCKTLFAEQHLESTSLYLTSATVAGAMTTLMLHPIFTIKTRLQLQLRTENTPTSATGLPKGLLPITQRDNYSGTWHAVRRMVQEEGALSLYRGIGPSMLLVSHGSIQFLVYENAKLRLASTRRAESAERAAALALSQSHDQYGHAGSASAQVAASMAAAAASAAAAAHEDATPLSARELFLATTGSKVCATLATYPYQVMRSCMQQRAVMGGDAIVLHTTSGVVRHIWRADGLAGFYRGIWPHMLRSTPQATITLMVYEYAARALSVTFSSGGLRS
jgi:solute carrier family 25 folate transporter 32